MVFSSILRACVGESWAPLTTRASKSRLEAHVHCAFPRTACQGLNPCSRLQLADLPEPLRRWEGAAGAAPALDLSGAGQGQGACKSIAERKAIHAEWKAADTGPCAARKKKKKTMHLRFQPRPRSFQPSKVSLPHVSVSLEANCP